MEKRIKKVMSSVFGIAESKINEKISPETSEKWDSLGHMKLVVALEEEFGVRFSDQDIIEILSLSLIKAAIKDKLQSVKSKEA